MGRKRSRERMEEVSREEEMVDWRVMSQGIKWLWKMKQI